jgi:pimeloyl-ACP methyl ester carboxylesterase
MQKTVLDYPVEWLELNPDGERLIVLLHGFGASTFSWRTVTAQLAELGHVIAYDRPGFGFTPLVERVNPDPYSLAGQVQLLKAVVEQNAKVRPVVVVGHSAGALVATEFALLHPELVNALVLESPAIWSKPPVPRFAGSLMRGAALERLGDRLLKSFAKAGMKILTDSFFDPAKLTDEVVAGYTAPMSRDEWRVALWRFMTADQSNGVRDNLRRLELPVLVITGDHDRIVKVEDTFKVAERITGHSIYLVPNTGHLAHEEDPTDFLRVVTRFIAKLRA